MTDASTNLSRRDFVIGSATLTGGLLAAEPARAAALKGAAATNQIVASHLTLWYRRPVQQWV